MTKGYTLAMEFCTTVRGTVTVVFADAAGTLCGEDRIFDVSTLTVEGSEDGTAVCKTVYLGLQTEPNSANCEISGTTTFTWTSSNGLTGSGSLDFYAATTPPCSYGPNPGCLPDPAEANCTDPVVTTTDEKLDVKVDEAPASADVATTDSAPAPAPAAPVEPAPAPAPADDASATSTP